MRIAMATLVVLSLLLFLACGGSDYDCSQEEYDRYERIHAAEGMTEEVSNWIAECGSRFE